MCSRIKTRPSSLATEQRSLATRQEELQLTSDASLQQCAKKGRINLSERNKQNTDYQKESRHR